MHQQDLDSFAHVVIDLIGINIAELFLFSF